MKKRILLVEDEKNLQVIIKLNLELEGWEVEVASDGKKALDKIQSAWYDLMVLDLMLPELSGMEVLDTVRLKNSDLPIIIISAKDTSTDRIEGLKSGADDYLNKPFEMEELSLRISKLLERSAPVQREDLASYSFGNNKINFKTQMAQNADGEFQLSLKECLIMKCLIAREGEVVSRQELLKQVWGYDVYPTTRTVDNFVSALRKYFESNIKSPQHIISIRGIGYKFVK